jgi:predicted negative regulator of RcsB-dependent stress response
MSVHDLEEQERIDTLKAWWNQHGNTVTLGIAVFAAVMAGIQGWRWYQQKQNVEAASVYQAVLAGTQANDVKKIRDAAGAIMEKYPSTSYATRAALEAARANYESGDTKSAKAQLQWVVDNASEVQARDVARLRLAGVLLDEKNYVEAAKLLDAKHDAAFDGLYSDMKGDVAAAQGKNGEARTTYQAALGKIDEKSTYRKFVEFKLDALGEAK